MPSTCRLPSLRLLAVVCLGCLGPSATAQHAPRTDHGSIALGISRESQRRPSGSGSTTTARSSSRSSSRSRGSSSSSSSSSSTASAVGGAASTSTGATVGAIDEPADFVIVGGGTAGCAVAARVCANLPHASVVLLERGQPRTEDEELLVRAPPAYTQTWRDPRLTQAWKSEPNPALLGRTVTQLTGNTLGGTSAINSAQWTRPPLATFNQRIWGFAGLDSARAGDLYRRVERQLQVALPPPSRQQTFTLDFLAAAEATGLPIDDDPLSRTGPAADGIWITPIATDSAGRRQDSCTAYLSPVTREGGACATRLRLIQSATVSRVVVEGGRAVGVQYIKTDAPEGKQLRRITAKKEVILSAGPYGSPQVLQLSGIGRPHVVGALGVHPVMDLPVGEDTLARPSTLVLDLYTAVPLAPEANLTLLLSPDSVETFQRGDGGVLAVSAGGTNGVLAASNAFSASLNTALPNLPSNLLSSFCGINPTARGFVRAVDPDPAEPPALHTNFLGNSQDFQDALSCGVRLQAVRDTLAPELGLVSLAPGPNFNDQVNAASLQATADTFYHVVAGCALGEVVDGDFKVMGIEGLRVVDASVQPELPPFAGPMSTVYMLAELASEIIVAAHR